MKPRRAGDPWFAVLYRDPHTLWWVPGLAVGAMLLLLKLLVFDSSVVEAVVVATLVGGAAAGGAWLRRQAR